MVIAADLCSSALESHVAVPMYYQGHRGGSGSYILVNALFGKTKVS